MPPAINYGQAAPLAPHGGNIFSSVVQDEFVAFPDPVLSSMRTTPEGYKGVQYSWLLSRAFYEIEQKILPHEPCRRYFQSLGNSKSLRDIWNSGRVVLHLIESPSSGTVGEMRGGLSTQVDIGLSDDAFAKGKMYLVATLIHELAHVAGAPGRSSGSIAAETALKHCLLSQYFDPDAVGALNKYVYGDDDNAPV